MLKREMPEQEFMRSSSPLLGAGDCRGAHGDGGVGRRKGGQQKVGL